VGGSTDELPELRQLLADGRAAEALLIIDRLLATEPDRRLRGELRLRRLAALINLGRRGDYAAALDAADDALGGDPDPERHGRLNALAAVVALADNSLERCVQHLVKSSRALAAATRTDEDLVLSWQELASAYSYAGFHGHALSALEVGRQAAMTAGISDEDYVANPAIRVRLAAWLDHHGDSDACIRVMRDVLIDLARHRQSAPGGAAGIRPSHQASYGYAIARLSAFGEATGEDSGPLLERAGQTLRARDLRLLARVCGAIGTRDTSFALGLLDQATIAPATMGAAEPYRLRALAYAAGGQYAEALAADRRAFRVATAQDDRLRDLFVDGVAARLDREHMQKTVARYQGEALTDPLTGLPNRRHLEDHVRRLIRAGETAILGVCDLDGFKAVNTVHGHLAGDAVLQRVAGVLARVMRKGDLVARYGGDEFVVVLPAGTMRDAREVAHRVTVAVAEEDWAALVPGTPVSITVGWAQASRALSIAEAFAAADHAMLRKKAS
jgi:diguanylate cyclase (GGDEF)-like protein